jgi:hypothetical protein
LTIHGFPRATIDIDILIRAESLERAYEIAAEKGYDIRGLDISFKERAVEIRPFQRLMTTAKFCRLIFCLLLQK